MAASNQLTKQQVQAYLSRVDIQTPLEAALNAAVNAQAEDPIVFFADYFAEKAGRTKAPAAAAAVSAERAQTAFVFTKPHANTEAVRNLVRRKFSDVGIEIVSEGDLDGPTIDANQHIDQHYYAIASKATLLHPSELNAPKAKFAEKFGEDWDALVAGGKLLNAKDACTKLGISAPELYTAWLASQDAGNCLKLGGGFYVAPVEVAGHEKMYTLNAFFMSMRGKFTAPDASIHFYVVRFDPATLAWADFRGAVLGPTDPANAPASSLRGMLAADWQALGLAAAPNTSDNGVHASASPFEGLAERMNWLKLDVAEDELARRLIDAGVSAELIKEWSVDPQVALPGGGKGSLFDQLEDLDIEPCVARAAELARAGTKLQILLQEDLTIRGGAQLWLMNCGSRLQASGHQVTFLLPSDSLIRDDCAAIDGAGVATYDREAIAESPDEFRSQFTELLRPAHVCVTLVRQKRRADPIRPPHAARGRGPARPPPTLTPPPLSRRSGGFQNVGFMGECIAAAGLKTFLIAKTGTPDPSYAKSFYGGPLLESGQVCRPSRAAARYDDALNDGLSAAQCCVITIAEYTKEFIVDKMGVPAELITNVYNGTDTAKFNRTPEMAAEVSPPHAQTRTATGTRRLDSIAARRRWFVTRSSTARSSSGVSVRSRSAKASRCCCARRRSCSTTGASRTSTAYS